MDRVLVFKNQSFYDSPTPGMVTIGGKEFQALMELCFTYSDTFSLHRCGWSGARNGALEQALRPYCLGEYLSYGILTWFDKTDREKCYLYPSNGETKQILLQHIHHLFGQEQSPAPAGHEAYLRQKYAAFHRAEEEADERWTAYLDHGGWDRPEEQRESFREETFRQARALWLEVFAEEDFYSTMEDPCFFRGDEMFFQTVTHAEDCQVHAFSPEFEQSLRALGEWEELPGQTELPLFSLKTAEGWRGSR